MEMLVLNVEPRIKGAKGYVKTLRKQGKIPGVCYGKEFLSMPVQVDEISFLRALKRKNVKDNILVCCNSKTDEKLNGLQVLVQNVDMGIFGKQFIHLDLHAINMNEMLEAKVPIHLVGESRGIKEQGGVLEVLKHSLAIECLPGDIPEDITVDISMLMVGNSMHVSDLQVPSGIKIKDNAREVILILAAPTTGIEAEEKEEVEDIEQKE